MAKKRREKKEEKKATLSYGTSKEWIQHDVGTVRVGDETFTDVVICKDDKGLYATRLTFVKARVMDPYRIYRRNEILNPEEIEAYVKMNATEEATEGAEEEA